MSVADRLRHSTNTCVRWMLLLVALSLAACGGENTSSNVTSPGAEATAKTRLLEGGANLLQDKAPLAALNAYLDGFHFYNGNMQGQMDNRHAVECRTAGTLTMEAGR